MQTSNKSISPWWTVAAGALGAGTGAGIVIIYAFGILANAMAAEAGWDRSVYSFTQTSFLIATGFGTVLLGEVIARYGVRRPSIVAIVIFAIAIALLAMVPASPMVAYALFAIIGISGAAASMMPYAIAISGWFDRHRGLALGLANLGAGAGAALTPQFAAWLNQTHGWRAGFVCIAATYGAVALFGLVFLVREPPTIQPARSSNEPDERTFSFTFMRERAFWLIGIPMLGVSVATFGVMGSIVPLLSDRGVPVASITVALTTAGIASWVSRVVVGYSVDRLFAPFVATATFAMALAGIALLATAEATSIAILGAAFVGFALGAEGDLVTYLVSRYFSIRIYGKVLGTMWISWAWGSGIGAYVVGATYKVTHTYNIALWIFAASLVMAGAVMCLLGPYKYPPPHGARRGAALLRINP